MICEIRQNTSPSDSLIYKSSQLNLETFQQQSHQIENHFDI